ncbi:hypothetical protein HU200_050325 [Digitaria exilis]|uniref:Uncharacterized protein n=1 Tax=Digitaria exilis TaxID=1010633 RepID=A0A835EAK6_9POAL|nr:hypothetical protein HU200_050325 [Digitaria exilis]
MSPADVLETEESRDLGQLPNNKRKRNKIEAANTELEGGSSDTGTEETQQRMTVPGAVGEGSSASPSASVSTTQRLRFPPFPKSGNSKDVRKWCKECTSIRQVLAKDPRRKLPTRRKPKDSGTTNAVLSIRDKVMVRGVARSIVSICSITHGKLSR